MLPLSFSLMLLALLFMRKKLRRRLLMTWPPAEGVAVLVEGIVGRGDGDDDDDDGDGMKKIRDGGGEGEGGE